MVAVVVLLLMAGCSSGGSLPGPASPTSAATTPTSRIITYPNDLQLRRAEDVSKLTGAPEDFKYFMAGVVADAVKGSDANDPCAPKS